MIEDAKKVICTFFSTCGLNIDDVCFQWWASNNPEAISSGQVELQGGRFLPADFVPTVTLMIELPSPQLFYPTASETGHYLHDEANLARLV